MAANITTTGTSKDPLSTARQPGESTGDWVARHSIKLGTTNPKGESLTTSWVSAGGSQSVTTTREVGETDAAFQSRHILEYTTAMIDLPPL